MSMTARERITAFIHGEEPDKIPVFALDCLITGGQQGGWVRRLVKRGMGIIRLVFPYQPSYFHPISINPYLESVKYIQINYIEKGLAKCRHIFETPVGSVTCVTTKNPPSGEDYMSSATEEHFVKEVADWRVINYIFKEITNRLAPNYTAFERMEDELGETGITLGMVGKTPYQRAWVELATPERTVIDFKKKPDELQEFIEIQRKLHMRIAEIIAESPATYIDLCDHITNMIPPYYYRDYCNQFYEIYATAVQGTGKVLGAHHDGRFGHLKKEIAEGPLKVIESYTVPPTGDVSLAEAKKVWPDKLLWINCPPHLSLAEFKEVKEGYEAIADEWGSKRGLALGHYEEIPLAKLESHLSAAMDAFGYR